MEKELARYVARESFKASSQISNLVLLLKEHCEEDEYQIFLKSIALVSATIGEEILSKIFSQYPELEKEIETQIKKYGVL